MNSLRLNGGMLNGARVIAALALVACTATAAISADATYVRPSSATITVSATLYDGITLTHTASAYPFTGDSYFVGNGEHTHATQSNVLGAAEFQAYSLREITAESFLGGTGFAAFVPASTLAYSNIGGGVSLEDAANIVQFGHTEATASAVTINSDVLISRFVEASLQGAGTLYVESCLNNVHDTYCNIQGESVILEESGLVFKNADAIMQGAVFLSAQQSYTHAVGANISVSSFVEATPESILNAQASITGSSSFESEDTYSRMASATVIGTAGIPSVYALQSHQANGLILFGGGYLTATSYVTLNAVATLYLGSCNVAAYTHNTWYVEGIPSGNVAIDANASVEHATFSDVVAVSTFDSSGNIPTPHLATSNFIVTSTVDAVGSQTHFGEANMLVEGTLKPIGYENLLAIVPAARSFTRPKTVREFVRTGDGNSFSRS